MATVKLPPLTDERLAEIGQSATDLGSLALELVAVRRVICPPEGFTLHDRLAELHDLLCSISGRIDNDHGIYADLDTAIGWAERLTADVAAVTP